VFGESENAYLFAAFLKKMLTKDQNERATIADLLDDDYLTKSGSQLIDLFSKDAESELSGSWQPGSQLKMSVV
jgi:hypothetical protein